MKIINLQQRKKRGEDGRRGKSVEVVKVITKNIKRGILVQARDVMGDCSDHAGWSSVMGTVL